MKPFPFLAVRNRILFPGNQTTIQVGRPRSLRLIKSFLNPTTGKVRDNVYLVISGISQEKTSHSDKIKFYDEETKGEVEIYKTACLAKVCYISVTKRNGRKQNEGGKQYGLVVEGVRRTEITQITHEGVESTLLASIDDTKFLQPSYTENPEELKAMTLALKTALEDLISGDKSSNGKGPMNNVLIVKKFISELTDYASSPDVAEVFVDQLTAVLLTAKLIDMGEAQTVLAEHNLYRRTEMVLNLIMKRQEILETSKKIHQNMKDSVNGAQREMYLRQQIKAINKELRNYDSEEEGDETDELDVLKEKLSPILKNQAIDATTRKSIQKDFRRLKNTPNSQPEHNVLRNYLDLVIDLPWPSPDSNQAQDFIDIDLVKAKQMLDADHYGLEKVKQRLIEFLAVRKMQHMSETNVSKKGAILCLVGPPGTGKTSLGKSVADVLGRPFARISLGGVRDEAEIRGHRRTYIGAMPGLILSTMKKLGSNSPVILLDEIDKLVSGRGQSTGDPGAALLEVLDPEQNGTFTDHYLNLPFDLSNVVFIATANEINGQSGSISAPLLDRMELIQLSSYTLKEKQQIATRHLLPKQLKTNAIEDFMDLEITDEAMKKIIINYTREAGVRRLEKNIGSVCRHHAMKFLRNTNENERIKFIVDTKEVEKILGPGIKSFEETLSELTPGMSMGLAWTSVGGEVLLIETAISPGTGRIHFTGQLGKVMEESVRTALSHIFGNATLFNLDHLYTVEWKCPMSFHEVLRNVDIHVHFPAGAVPKDGPSAGVAVTSALLSSFYNKKIKSGVCMTGEISLTGRVLPVGGIKEKVLAAHRAGISKVLLPSLNEADFVEMLKDGEPDMANNMNVMFLNHVYEAIEHLFEYGVAEPPGWMKEVIRAKPASRTTEFFTQTHNHNIKPQTLVDPSREFKSKL